MRKAALFVHGRVIVGDSHLEAYRQLSISEQSEDIVSGFFNPDTEEFNSDLEADHFYDKEVIMVRHGDVDNSKNPDPSLSSEGELKVLELANHLLTFDLKGHIGIVSPLLRCLQTATILQEVLKIDFQVQRQVVETPIFLQDDEEFSIMDRQDAFPSFQWPSNFNFILKKETPQNFLNRSRDVLQHLPHKSIVITHFGFICNIARLALCPQKAGTILNDGVPTASVTFINKQEVSLHENPFSNRPQTQIRKIK